MTLQPFDNADSSIGKSNALNAQLQRLRQPQIRADASLVL